MARSWWIGLMVLLLVAGCQGPEQEPPGPVARQALAIARPSRIVGQVQLKGEPDASGIQIYIPGTSLVAITGRDGRFTLTGAEPGMHEIWARTEGYQPVELGQVDVMGPEGQETYALAAVTLDFQSQAEPEAQTGGTRATAPKPEPGALRGQLRSEDEPPDEWTGATIELANTPYRTAAAADGTFFLWSLPADQYQLVARMNGYETTTTSVRVLPGPEATTVTVAMTPSSGAGGSGLIAIRTYPTPEPGGTRPGPAGAAAPTTATTTSVGRIHGVALRNREGIEDHSGISITLTGSSLAAATDEDGRYVIEGIKPGRYQLLAQTEGFEPARLPLEVPPGADLEIEEILLEPQLDYPRVLQVTPPDGTRNVTVAREIPIVVRFSKKMNPDALRQAVRIEPAVAYQIVAGREGGDTDYDLMKIVVFGAMQQPVARFRTRYTLTISEAATDFEGLGLEKPFQMDFTTGAPSVIQTMPRDRDAGVGLSPQIPVIVMFNAPMDPSTLTPETVRISPRPALTPEIAVREAPDTGWSNLNIKGMWKPDTEYRVTITGRARTIRNDSLANTPFSFRFRTGKMVLPTRPTIPQSTRGTR